MNKTNIKYSLLLLIALLPIKALALNVFACEPQWGSLANTLGGSNVTVYTATDANQDPHHVQARPSLISRVHRADIVVCTGADLEVGWLPVLLEQAGNSAVTRAPGLFYADKQTDLLNTPKKLDRALGDIHPDGNPHAHLDPHRLLTMATALSARFATLDPANSADYQQQLTDFTQQWQASIDKWEQQAAPLKGTAVIVHHDEWIYLLDWLGMSQAGELEPKPGLPPTPSHLARLIGTVKARDAKLIVYAPHNSADASKWLASHSDACALRLPFTVGGNRKATDLFSLYSDTINRLLNAKAQCQHG